MKILLINHYAGSPEMGMEFRPYYFSKEWIKQGHEVNIIASDFSHLRRINPQVDQDFEKENIDGINYFWVKTNRYDSNGVKRSLTMFEFIAKLLLKTKWIVKELNPDVVICSSTYPLDTYVGQRIKKISQKQVKLIHEVHDMWPATLYEIGGMSKKHPFVMLMQWAENSAYRNSDKVVSLLPNAEKYMMEHGLKKGKFVCIPNGVILDEWKNPLPLPENHESVLNDLKKKNKFIVGYFGGHAKSNALDLLLEAAKMIDTVDIHFVLVGSGVEKERLIKRSKHLKLKNVTFLPPIRKKSVPNLCKYFDCIYMGGLNSPLYRFGLCLNKMFDTMASGKIGICALSVKSYFTTYQCGFDINAKPTEICRAIYKIKELSFDELKMMENNGLNAAKNIFNYQDLSQRFIEVIDDCF